MNQKIQKISVKGIVYRDGKIFMLKDEGGKWDLPGGRIDFGEHPDETLRREFMEELGVADVDINRLINVWDFTVEAEGDDYQFIIVVFECRADLQRVALSSEHSQYQWVVPEEISSYPIRDGYIESIKKFIELKKNVAA